MVHYITNLIATANNAGKSNIVGTLKKHLQLTTLFLMLFAFAKAQTPTVNWAAKTGGASNDVGLGVGHDSQGNAYVTGYFAGTVTYGSTTLTSAGSNDIFLLKYDANGSIIWAKKAGGSADDQGLGLTVDANGNVIISGIVASTNAQFEGIAVATVGSYDVFVAKYDSNGNIIWVRTGGGTNQDYGWSVGCDNSGNVYVGGSILSTSATFGTTTLTTSGSYDVFVAKYDASGNFIQVKSAGGVGEDIAYSIAVHPDGICLYVTGRFAGTATFGSQTITSSGGNDVFVAGFDFDTGTWKWARKAGGTGSDTGQGTATDDSCNVYITGQFSSATVNFSGSTLTNSGSSDIFIAKYNEQGDLKWVKKAGGTGADYGSGISVDATRNIYVTGYISGTASFETTALTSNGGLDIFAARYKADATLDYAVSYGGTGSEYGRVISSDNQGNAYITGPFQNSVNFGGISLTSTGGQDVYVMKLGASIPNTITIQPLAGNTFVVGDAIQINFTTTGTFNAGNIFTAQLSDANGNFANAIDIGNINSTTSGTINATIPANTVEGNNYHIRITSSNPVLNSNEDVVISISRIQQFNNINDLVLIKNNDQSIVGMIAPYADYFIETERESPFTDLLLSIDIYGGSLANLIDTKNLREGDTTGLIYVGGISLGDSVYFIFHYGVTTDNPIVKLKANPNNQVQRGACSSGNCGQNIIGNLDFLNNNNGTYSSSPGNYVDCFASYGTTGGNSANCWYNADYTPDVFNFSSGNFNSILPSNTYTLPCTTFARCGASLNNLEQIGQEVNVTANTSYIFEFYHGTMDKYKELNADVYTNEFKKVDYFYIILHNDPNGVNTAVHVNYNSPPSFGSGVQVIYEGIGKDQWTKEKICFTTNAAYQFMQIIPFTTSTREEWHDQTDPNYPFPTRIANQWLTITHLQMYKLVADAGTDASAACSDCIQLDAKCIIPLNGVTYNWTPLDGLISTSQATSVAVTPTSVTDYTLTVNYNNGACVATDVVHVTNTTTATGPLFTVNSDIILNGTNLVCTAASGISVLSWTITPDFSVCSGATSTTFTCSNLPFDAGSVGQPFGPHHGVEYTITLYTTTGCSYSHVVEAVRENSLGDLVIQHCGLDLLRTTAIVPAQCDFVFDAYIVFFSNASNFSNVTVDYGDGSTPTSYSSVTGSTLTLSHTYPASGNYTIMVTYEYNGQSSSETYPVNVSQPGSNGAPDITVTQIGGTLQTNTFAQFQVANCVSYTYVVKDASGNIYWDGGSTFNVSDIIEIGFYDIGDYTLEVTGYNDACCSQTVTVQLNVPTFIAVSSGNNPASTESWQRPNLCDTPPDCGEVVNVVDVYPVVCPGAGFTVQAWFTRIDQITGISWSPATGVSDPSILNPTIVPTATTDYTVSVNYTSSNGSSCTAIKIIHATVRTPQGSITTNAGEGVCAGQPVTLGALNAASATWEPGGLSGLTVSVTPAVTTTYTATLTDAFGCVSTKQTTITVLPASRKKVTLSASNTDLCNGNVLITAGVSGNNNGVLFYTWYMAGNATPVQSGSSNQLAVTAAGTYTVYVSSFTSCFTNTSAGITITANNPNAALTISSNSICTGQTATLTATTNIAGVTYSWFFNGTLLQTTTTGSIQVSQLGDYYVIVSNGNCQAQTAVTHLDVTTASPLEITGPASACDASHVYTVTSGFVSYSWQAVAFDANGVTITVSPSVSAGGTSATINWPVSGANTLGGTITVTAVGNAPCNTPRTVTFDVKECCGSNRVYNITTTALTAANVPGSTMTTPGGVKTFTGGSMIVNGVLIVDNNITFSGTEIKMAPDAKIWFESSGKTLKLDANGTTPTHIHAAAECKVMRMWDDIGVPGTDYLTGTYNNNSLIIQGGTIIQDADTAVVLPKKIGTNDAIKLTVNNAIFNLNNVGIYTATTISSTTSFIQKATFAGYDRNTSFVINTTATGTLIAPYAGQNANMGIAADGVTAFNLNPSAGNGNLFDRLKFGNYLKNTAGTIQRNTYQNLIGGYVPTLPGSTNDFAPNPATGYGIYTVGGGSNALTIGGNTSTDGNTFKENYTDIYVEKVRPWILNNTMTNTAARPYSTGISIKNCAAQTRVYKNQILLHRLGVNVSNNAALTLISGNTITAGSGAFRTGINCIGNTGIQLRINNTQGVNTISGFTFGINASNNGAVFHQIQNNVLNNCTQGIWVTESAAAAATSSFIRGNTISGSLTGINLANIFYSTAPGDFMIDGNTISGVPANGSGIKGDRIKAQIGETTRHNSITGVSNTAATSNGIFLSNCQNSYVTCNDIYSIGNGIHYNLNCLATTMRANNLNNCYNGLFLENDAQAGGIVQGNANGGAGNTWNGAFTNQINLNNYGNGQANATIIGWINRFTMTAQNGTATYPTSIMRNNSATQSITSLNTSLNCGTNFRIKLNNGGGHLRVMEVDHIVPVLEEIARTNYNETNPANIAANYSLLLQTDLSQYNDLSPQVQIAQDSLKNTVYGLFEQIKNLLNTYDSSGQNVNNALALINTINPTNQQQEWQKQTLLYYTNYKAGISFDTVTLTQLQTIAQGCPAIDGNEVYEARVLCDILFQTYSVNNNCAATATNRFGITVVTNESNLVTIEAEGKESISESTSGIKVQPNPFSNKLSITGNMVNIASMKLLDAKGTLIQSFSLENKTTISEFATEQLSTGVYVLNVIYTDGHKETIKLIKH